MTPPLRSLHPSSSLIDSKLQFFRCVRTEVLIDSLRPGMLGALKTRVEGTILDGHHRLEVLRERGFDVNSLPREEIVKDSGETER